MDHYLQGSNCLNRLKEEYIRYGKLIIAYDFDDTVYDFHNQGRTYDDVITLLKEFREYAYFIVLTASSEERYPEIKAYLEEKQIPYDAINEGINLPGIPKSKIKPYFNALLDDRAGLSEVYNDLTTLIKWIRRNIVSRKMNIVQSILTERYKDLNMEWRTVKTVGISEPYCEMTLYYNNSHLERILYLDFINSTEADQIAEFISCMHISRWNKTKDLKPLTYDIGAMNRLFETLNPLYTKKEDVDNE